MKQNLVLGATAVSLLLLSACTNGTSRFVKQNQFDIDYEYVAAVEQTGHKKGVRIMWMHPPTKQVLAESDIRN